MTVEHLCALKEAPAGPLFQHDPFFSLFARTKFKLTKAHSGQKRISAEAPVYLSGGLPLAAAQKRNDCSLPRVYSFLPLSLFFILFSHRSQRTQKVWLQNVTPQEQVSHMALALCNCCVTV